ncbi:MAG: hypothetical protein WCG87_08540 [Bacteroidota bacterium]
METLSISEVNCPTWISGYFPMQCIYVIRYTSSMLGKAHSASYAVESFQSLYLKTYYPLEFMVAVINNFGGFYSTRVYINEAKKAGGTLHLPCVNNSTHLTTLYGTDVYLGFIHIKSLEHAISEIIEQERNNNGNYINLEDFILRTRIGIESLITLIRINALRFTGKSKRQLLWEAHMLFDKEKAKRNALAISMFSDDTPEWDIPQLVENKVSDVYDELELLEFPVSMSSFELLKSDYRGECMAKDLMSHIGETIRMVGSYVTYKGVRTVKGDLMAFGTFLDEDGHFFDTTHFPPSLKTYPFTGGGVYLILGKVVEEFGFPSIEVEKMGRMGYKKNPISE